MHNFKLYRLAKELQATCERPIAEVKKICTSIELVFLLTESNELFFGHAPAEKFTIHFIPVRVNIADIACSPDTIYAVDLSGCVHKCPLLETAAQYEENQWVDVPVIATQPTFQLPSHKNFTCDSRLWTDIGANVRITKVYCNADGVLFLSINGDLYGMGDIPDVCVSEQPILIPFFADYEIIQVATGKHFIVVLTRSKHISRRSNSAESVNNDSLSLNSSTYSINTTASNICSSKSNRKISVATTMVENQIGDDSIGGDFNHNRSMSSANTSKSSSQETLDTIESASSSDHISLKTLENYAGGESSSSENISVIADIENEISKLLKLGSEIIRTNVWCFGTVNKGHLGTGDHIRRKHAVQLISLNEQGVQKVSCGDDHTAALTVDGRLYLWGDNGNEQISHWLEKEGFSSPKRYHKSEQNILDVNCGQFSTFILTNSLDRYELSRNKHFATIPLTNNRIDPLQGGGGHCTIDGYDEPSRLQFLAHGNYLLIGESNFIKLRFECYLKYEQEYLQDILQKVAPFFPKFLHTMHRNIVRHPTLYRQFFTQYNSIISITAVNIETMNLFGRGKYNCAKLSFVRHVLEYIAVYRMYAKCYCEILCSDDYKRMCETILPNTDFKAKFSTPLDHICNYIAFAKELSAIDTIHIIKTAQTHWEQFKLEMDAMLESAEKTVEFWKMNSKSLPLSLHIPDRRFIQDSKQLQLKLIPATRFTSQWFILFNDMFCVCSGSTTVKQHALKTLWVCSVADKEIASSTTTLSSLSPALTGGTHASRRFALEVITPEERFIVGAQTLETKFKWLDAFEHYIRLALGRTDGKSTGKVPAYRIATYTFSDKHKSYGKCRYTGCWFAGQLHGNGYLEFPDGRIYTGQFSMGSICGYGRWILPGISCYEGMFNGGKYHGYGTLEIQNQNGTYEGSFKNGQQNGHGVLINDYITYIGEFSNGQQNGFGVLDNSHTGEKYMGMFVDNKRSGHGFCITVEGQYFEGQFIDDELCGSGVAVFTDESYYEGDLTMHGPNGRGTLYLPRESVKTENYIDLDEKKLEMIGNIVSGTLGGTWNDIKINNGNLALNQHFPKYSKSAGSFEFENKWHSLFKDWEQDVFGMAKDDIVDNKKIWNKINIFIRTIKQNEWLKSTLSSTGGLLDHSGVPMPTSYELDERTGILGTSRSSHNDKSIPKSYSLSRITGSNYKRNILAIERHKSISNEVLVNSTSYFPNDDLECNNNNKGIDRMSSLLVGGKTSAPCFGISKLDKEDMILVRDYLSKAFKSHHHPLGVLNAKVSYCFYTSYGCWKVKPIAMLAIQAMNEWENISKRIYDIVRKLFPTLPSEYGMLDEEFISHRTLLYPILLSEGIYSTLFVLYANKCSQRDEIYRQRIMACEKKTDLELIEFLRINSNYMPMIQNSEFQLAINCLKQVKEKFCPREMLKLIEMTFKYVESSADMANTNLNISTAAAATSTIQSNSDNGAASSIPPTVMLNADTMMPLSIFLIIRAAIPHLGTEILLLEDLMGSDFEMLGFANYCFTTIKAGYQHIINDQFLHQ